jgi:hypothetical protein
MRKSNESNDSGFYYIAGLCFGHYFGDVPLEFRHKVVGKFKDWVLIKNGSNPLPDDRFTIDGIVRQFIYEFKKGEARAKYRH